MLYSISLCYTTRRQEHYEDGDDDDVVVLLLAMAGRTRPPCLFSSPDFCNSKTSVERGAPRFVKPSVKSGSLSDDFKMWCFELSGLTPLPLLSLDEDDGSIEPLSPPPPPLGDDDDAIVVVCC